MLKVHLFGAFRLEDDDKPLGPIRSRKGQWLLALLLLRNGQVVTRDWLAGTLWPDQDESQALAYLRREIYLLKQTLGLAGERVQSPTTRTLSFDLSGVAVDVLAFDAALKQGDTEQAVSLYTGPLMEGSNEEWGIRERQVREEAFLQALETLGERAIAQGRPTAALPYLRRLIQHDPLRESAHRSLLQALAADGDYAAMTMAYRDLRLLLRQEIQSDPSPETTALYQQLRAGMHRDVPEKSVEAEKSAPPSASTTPLVSPHPPIPHPLTPLIGRDAVVRGALNCLTTARLMTLTGTGGVGKTRVAIAVAQEKAATEEVWFVELAALTAPPDVPLAVAKALGRTEESGLSLQDTLARTLSTHPALLVLDNCEHLLDACAQLCAFLLRACPQLQILTTSRQSLGMFGEVTVTVPALELPPLSLPETPRKRGFAPLIHRTEDAPEEDAGLLAILVEYEAVCLFVERAQAVAPHFALTPQNAATVTHICHHLEGIPLAIELAAARVKALSVEQIQTRLGNRLRLLSGGNRAAMPHHQTLRALIDWSYGLLTNREKTLLAYLSVFAGGWTLEMAEALCEEAEGERQEERHHLSPYEVVDLLASLVDKSLVQVHPNATGQRYGLLEMIREYASEKLQETGEEPRIRLRHLTALLYLAEEAEPQLRGPQQVQWLQRLETEQDNLRAALEWSAAGKEVPSALCLRLVGALSRYWGVRGYLTEGRQNLRNALAQAGADTPPTARAKALRGAGLMACQQSDYAAAQALLEESLALEQALGNRSMVGELILRLGQVAQYREDLPGARNRLKEALAIGQEAEDRWLVFQAQLGLGLAAEPSEDYHEAQTWLKAALKIARELDDRVGISTTLSHLGQFALMRGDYEGARTYLEEALQISREIQVVGTISITLTNLGYLVSAQGKYAEARCFFEEALAIAREQGDRRGIAWALTGLGRAAFGQGESAEAVGYLRESLQLRHALQEEANIAECLLSLADVYHAQGEAVHAANPASPSEPSSETVNSIRLLGFLETLQSEDSTLLSPQDRTRYEYLLSQYSALEEPVFATIRAEGRALTLEQAVALALGATV